MRVSEKMRKLLSIFIKIVTYLVGAFAVFMIIFTIVTVSTVDKNERSLFGIRFYIVKTDSMSKSENNADLDVHFNAGDIIIVKNAKDPTALSEGDVITFISTNIDSYSEVITHMIREVKKDSDGRTVGYVTYGTNTGTKDEAIVEPEYVLGKYAGKLPALGNFFAFVKTTPGYIVCILVPFLLLILYNGVNVIRLFKRYKEEQNAAIQAEKDQISEERRQNEQMLRELQALKEQLARQSEASAPAPAPEATPAPETDSAAEQDGESN